jgi:hypothetical protein
MIMLATHLVQSLERSALGRRPIQAQDGGRDLHMGEEERGREVVDGEEGWEEGVGKLGSHFT